MLCRIRMYRNSWWYLMDIWWTDESRTSSDVQTHVLNMKNKNCVWTIIAWNWFTPPSSSGPAYLPSSSFLLPAPCSGNWSPANCLKILEHMGLEAAPGPGVGRGSPGLRVNGPGKDGWVTEAGVRIGVGQYWSEVWGVQHPAYTAKR